MTEYVILVDELDRATGQMEKQKAHELGELHRAISVLVFNDRGELLLQQRAGTKYHSPLLWTNTCCSHPRPGEALQDAAGRRLMEEMRMACELSPAFSFLYKAVLEQGLTEHEFDHVYIGHSNALPEPDPAEVADWKYLGLEAITAEIADKPESYSEWFKLMLPKIKSIRNEYTD